MCRSLRFAQVCESEVSMSFMIEMVRDSAEAGGRDRFSVSDEAWDLLQEIGKTFGWKPAGATYARHAAAKPLDAVVLHDYRPGDRLDAKIVADEDARAWAAALTTARHSPHLLALIGARPGVVVLDEAASKDETRSANAPFAVSMNEFIEYAFGGAFSFARSH
jgi:hypothetical protein